MRGPPVGAPPLYGAPLRLREITARARAGRVPAEQLRREARDRVVELELAALLGGRELVVHDLLRDPQHDDAEAPAREDLVVVQVADLVPRALLVVGDRVLVRRKSLEARRVDALAVMAVEEDRPADVALGAAR